MHPNQIPEISVQALAEKLAAGEDFILLDVREQMELARARLGDLAVVVPLSELAQRQLEALPPEIAADKTQEVVVMCHHGARSAQVVAWLRANGWQNVFNLTGGIDAYARFVDPSVGLY